ncbi:MAG: hypothetical protein M1825_001527 [Sarcosagium campestre]|nr:MAG: hypothetical protein M1825_001527 [Sarcosagium campestre]
MAIKTIAASLLLPLVGLVLRTANGQLTGTISTQPLDAGDAAAVKVTITNETPLQVTVPSLYNVFDTNNWNNPFTIKGAQGEALPTGFKLPGLTAASNTSQPTYTFAPGATFERGINLFRFVEVPVPGGPMAYANVTISLPSQFDGEVVPPGSAPVDPKLAQSTVGLSVSPLRSKLYMPNLQAAAKGPIETQRRDVRAQRQARARMPGA